MRKTTGVYAILNCATGRVYVGSSLHIEKRWEAHRWALRLGSHHCSRLQRSWKRHGESAFAFKVLETCEPHELLAREQHHINREGALYNASVVAGRIILSREAIERRNAAIKEAYRNRPRVPRSAEVRAKLSAALKGKPKAPRSAEYRENIAAALRGKPHTRERVEKRLAKMRGRPWSEKRRLSGMQSMRGRPWSQARREAENRRKEARG